MRDWPLVQMLCRGTTPLLAGLLLLTGAGLIGCEDDNGPDITECEIGLLQPQGGRWTVGDSVTIAWSAGEHCGQHVRIDLFHAGDSCQVIADSASGGKSTGNYIWVAARCAADSADYAVRVQDLATGRYDLSDEPFVIAETGPSCTLELTHPIGGEYWVPGTDVTITWESTDCGELVNLELLREGAVCDPIATGAPNNGSYDWIVEGCGTQTAGYAVRITDADSGVSAQSAGTFSITTEIPLSYALSLAAPGEHNDYQFARLLDLDPDLSYIGGAVIDTDTCIRGHGAVIDLAYTDNILVKLSPQLEPTRLDIEYCIIQHGTTSEPFGGAVEYEGLCYGWVSQNTFFENLTNDVYLWQGVRNETPEIPGMRVFHNIFALGGVCGPVRHENQPEVTIRYNCSYGHSAGNFCEHCGCPSNPTPDELEIFDVGPGNFDDNPLFISADPKNTDLHLQPNSPCIGAGENNEDLGALPFVPARR